MRALLLGLVWVSGAVSPSFAATQEWKGYTETIAAGKVLEEELSCTKGALLSGGYSLDSTNGPRDKLIVVVNGPVADDKWSVALMNDHHAPVRVLFRVSILCD
jgi:hypothetical protein